MQYNWEIIQFMKRYYDILQKMVLHLEIYSTQVYTVIDKIVYMWEDIESDEVVLYEGKMRCFSLF